MSKDELDISNRELLEKLHLMRDGKLKRSAVLLFHGDPSVVQVGSHVQIGRFGKGADLMYQDTLEGSLICTADKVIDLIFLKYLKAKVSFEHDRRIETYPFAREAVREAVFNAIVHNCYMFGAPIQIRIEDEAMIISNQCFLPEGWTVETLMQPHESRPYNPEMAEVFYRAGYIEHWGRGIQKICDACRELGAELPTYELVGTGMRVRFKALESALIGHIGDQKVQRDILEVQKEESLQYRLLEAIKESPESPLSKLAVQMGVSVKTVQRVLDRLRDHGRLVRVGGKRYGHWEIKE